MKILISRVLIPSLLIAMTTFNASAKDTTEGTQCLPFMQHSEKKLHAKDMLNLCELTAGKPMLIVNTASHCGFTPQFTALEALHKEYKDNLVVIGVSFYQYLNNMTRDNLYFMLGIFLITIADFIIAFNKFLDYQLYYVKY